MGSWVVLLCLPGLLTGQRNTDNSLTAGMQQFTQTFLQNLENSTAGNFLFSPYSLHSVFTQLLVGAGGSTATQLERLLGVAGSGAAVSYQALTAGLQSGDSTSSELRVANQLAIARGFKPKTEFHQQLLTGFGSSIAEYDFSNSEQRHTSVERINSLVATATAGNIEDLLLEEDIDAQTRLVLINAIYYKAAWKEAFNSDESFDHIFESPVAGNITTRYMTSERGARMLEDSQRGIRVLELPYADPARSMLLVLPTDSAAADTPLAARLAGLNLAEVRDQPLLDTVVTIPAFSMKYQTYLAEKMRELGAGEVFSLAANLQGISNEPLFATEGIHQAAIEVNEEGSEAAAATAVVVGLRTVRRRRQFFADQPFMFIIYDFERQVPLFAGKVVDPSNLVGVTRSAPLPVQSSAAVAQPGPAIPGTEEQCRRFLRDFPNALDNKNICERVEQGRIHLDWLRQNRQLCDQSRDLVNNFSSTGCGPAWCELAGRERAAWQQDQAASCTTTTAQNKQFCKNFENKFKAIEYLNCL